MDDMSLPEKFWVDVTDWGHASCCLQELGGCDGRVEAHHVVPKMRIKQAYKAKLDQLELEQLVWDSRNGVPLCHYHHHLITVHSIKLPRHKAPFDTYAFAAEHGLLWSLERDLE